MRRPLRCYLLRLGSSPGSALTESAHAIAAAYHFDEGVKQLSSLDDVDQMSPTPGEAVVVTFSDMSGAPWWQDLLATEIDLPDFAVGPLPTRGAVVFCSVNDLETSESRRWIAWTFGSGSRYLDRSSLEPRFGVISALNRLIGEDNNEALLRKLQYRQQGAYRQRVGHVASSDTPIGGFRIDRIHDLLVAAGGKPPDDDAQVFGSRNLVYRTDIPALIETVRDESPEVMALYREDRYRTHFGFIDNYIPVDDRELTAELGSVLIEDILDERDTVDVAYPDDLVDFNDERAIEFVLFPNERLSQASRKVLTVDMVRRLIIDNPEQGLDAELRFVDADRYSLGTVPLQDCLAAEVSADGERYYLAVGTYYHVSAEFIDRIDEEIADIPTWDVPLPRYDGGREDEWTHAAAEAGEFIVLDGTRIYLPGETPFEPADLIHTSGAMLHVKRKGRSSALSYLFVQASTSAQLLSDPDAATKLRDLVDERGSGSLRSSVKEALVALDQTRPDLEIVLTILGDWHQRTIRNVPLIAKLELQATTQVIRQRGFRPHLSLVPLVSRP